jgi:hypothetical protein
MGMAEEEGATWEFLSAVRYAAYKPGGPMAMALSRNPTVLVVNDTVFAHGGLLPAHGGLLLSDSHLIALHRSTYFSGCC